MVEDVCFLYKRRWKNTLKLRFLSQKSKSTEKVEEHVKAEIFISKTP
ncbi:hypothetical protein AAZX31_18G112700 [Glycine max]